MSAAGRPSLSIVIPALNEEGAIGDTLRRCLAARDHIAAQAGLGAVEVLVVSDGSSDRTEAIALGFPEVTVLTFERNRGYGAALKLGIRHAKYDWILITDADGTYPVESIPALLAAAERSEMVVGARLGASVSIPLARRPAKVVA